MSIDPLVLIVIGVSVVFVGLLAAVAAVIVKLNNAADAKKRAKIAEKAKREASYITQTKFQQIKLGMLFDEVVSVVGPPEQELGSAAVGDIETTVFMWRGGIIANATLTFQNGKLVGKSQVGL